VVTKERDLRTGRPIWLARRMWQLPHKSLDGDITTDVLIVGAGITGAFLAERLAAAGHEVVVADRRRHPLLGSTPASTALIEYEIDTPLTTLTRQIGRDNAIRAWRRARLAVDAIAARTRQLRIACDLEERDNLLLAGNALGARALAREGEARRRAGLETQYLGRRALRDRFGLARSAALLSFRDLAADPRRMATGYFRAAIRNGAAIYARCHVAGVDARKTVVIATTGDGHKIRCRHLVYATGYELPDAVRSRRHRIVSTFALATRPQPDRLWPQRPFFWEASDPYLYGRTTADGRVICGGEDVECPDEGTRDRLLPGKIRTIRRKLKRLFPALDTRPHYVWAGSFGATTTGLPSIGRVPRMRNCWAVLGFGGNGITYARIAADLIGTGIAGRDDPDADLYALGA
jgi:glycine/D-amino acid oxidase-like deaminating enzyme